MHVLWDFDLWICKLVIYSALVIVIVMANFTYSEGCLQSLQLYYSHKVSIRVIYS